MQVLVLLCTNNHHYRQLTVNDLTEWEPFPDINLYKKNIISKSNGKFDSVITWPLDIPVSSLMMFVILLFFYLLYFSQIYIGKRFPFCQIIYIELAL
jgi:hypothetical protein